MSDFKAFAQAVNERLNSFARSASELFSVELSGNADIFATYLASFPAGTDPIFRERTEHDCNCCKAFVRGVGGVVRVGENGELETLWSGHTSLPEPYKTVAAHLDNVVKSGRIKSVYRTTENKYGKQSNVDNYDQSITWNHFWGDVPSRCVSESPGSAANAPNTAASVLRRGLDEIDLSHLDTVLDLIDNNSLYRGGDVRAAVAGFRELKAGDDGRSPYYHWACCRSPYAMFRNTAIGTLLTDLASGTDLDTAVRAYERKVAPESYKRTSAVITAGMVEQAMKTVEGLGLTDSLQRRYARLQDISAADVLFVDNAVAWKMKGGVKELLMAEVKKKPRGRRSNAAAVPIAIEDFMAMKFDSVKLLLEPRHSANFVTLTSPTYPDSPSLFGWSNGFGWSYEGNVADSIKQRVKKAGGNVTNAALRCSLAWYNKDDLDIHARTPEGYHIYFGYKHDVLDVDMNAHAGHLSDTPVENLSWTKNKLRDGEYKISVNCFSRRTTDRPGCELEVECEGGVIRSFEYSKMVCGTVDMLRIVVRGGAVTEVKTLDPDVVEVGAKGGEVWGVKVGAGAEADVTTIFKSPNHWDGESGKGALHWMFMLDGCANPERARGVYNEFLRPDLIPHRKVFEVLGGKMVCEGDDQLAGVGFTHARNDSVLALVNGHQLYEVNF